jgi:DNA topoisomerase VI subunit B
MRKHDAAHKLKRQTFKTSRLLDFANQKELTAQIGYARKSWPVYALKELLDNAIDACEDADIAPVISVTANNDGLTVEDNGPGIPAETITGVIDFAVRVSSREAYVSPTRGAQGNALKTVLAIPFVESDNTSGSIEIEALGKLHKLTMTVDRLRQEPVVNHEVSHSKRKLGTMVRVKWPKFASKLEADASAKFLQIAEDFTWLNPHLDLSVRLGKTARRFKPTNADWEHWQANEPTSPHWYDLERFERLVCAYAAQDQERGGPKRTVREFVTTFRGLSGTAKQKAILGATGLTRNTIISIAENRKAMRKLHDAMRTHSLEMKPDILGYIGEQHFRQRCKEAGCFMPSFKYARSSDLTDGVPSLVEVVFCTNQNLDWHQDFDEDDDEDEDEDAPWRDPVLRRRRLITGVNWSPGLRNTFRELGPYGESLDTMLGDEHVSDDDPVYFVVHMACPRPHYTDRGKTGVVLS